VGPRAGLNDVEKILDPTGIRTPTHRSHSTLITFIIPLPLPSAFVRLLFHQNLWHTVTNHSLTKSDNKVRELATVCMLWQQWTETSVWSDDVGISACHSCHSCVVKL
jgi:hypothetical protein